MWAVILIDEPLMFAGFFRYNDMQFEQFEVEYFYHILAVKKYREMGGNSDNMDAVELNFTDAKIAETVERFYTFEYSYSYGHYSGNDCQKRTRTVVHNRGTKDEWTETITTYYCDKNHQWLHGKVTNKTLDEELERCRANIVKTKGKIEFHKDMLKKLEHKEIEQLELIGAIKLQDLHSIISTRGYNIDDLREAMIAGDFSGIIPQNPAEKTDGQAETPAPLTEDIPQKEGKLSSGDENSQEENKSAAPADKDNNLERKNEI